jgi:hypothetical protein
MKEIRRAYVDGDIVELKKGMFGYRVVHPVKNADGSKNLVNFLVGGWGNFIALLFILLVLGLFFVGFRQVTASCKELADNPCASCRAYVDATSDWELSEEASHMGFDSGWEINLSKLEEMEDG